MTLDCCEGIWEEWWSLKTVRIKSGFKSRPLAGYCFIFHSAAIFSSLVLNQCFLLSLHLRLVHFWDTFQHLISTLPTQKNKQGPKDQSWERAGRIPVGRVVAWKLFFLEADFSNSMLLTPRPSQVCSQQLIGGRLHDGLQSWYLVLDSGSGTHRASLGSLWCLGLPDLEWMPPCVGELSCLPHLWLLSPPLGRWFDLITGSMEVFDGSNLVLTLQKLLKGFGHLTLEFWDICICPE